MCVDYGSVPDWFTAGAAGLGAWTAFRALGEWRKQLYGTSKHSVAVEIATAAGNLCYEFYRLRDPMVEAYEFPPSYSQRPPGQQRTNTEVADEFQHAFQKRWSEFLPHGQALAELRGKALMLLDRETADAVEVLAREAGGVKTLLDQYVELLRAGEGVKQWTDQKWVNMVRDHTLGRREDENDPISSKFEKALADLRGKLQPHLHDS